MSKNRSLVPVLAGLGAAAVGVVAYVWNVRRKNGAAPVPEPEAEPVQLRESMVVPRADVPRADVRADVPRAGVPDPLEVDLDLDGIFRGVDDLEGESEEPTVRPDVKVRALAGADDAEPPGADELGEYWLSRATQSERSLNEGDLEIDLDQIADAHDEADPEDDEQELALAAGERD